MKRVRMIITKTTTHSIYKALSDDEVAALQNADDQSDLIADYTSDENIIDGGYELDEFEVVEE